MSDSILVVDDNEDNSLLLTLTLESVGYEVTSVDNGRDALKTFSEIHPQLVLMDIMMPEMSGLQVAHKMKQKQNGEYLPILFVSAVDRLEDEYLSNSEADSIIYKPFDLDELINKVSTLIKDK